MKIFVLCTGRCGSTTFIRACQHITNYTALHESRTGHLGDVRFAYQDNHIEADNRLSWLLGRLDEAYGKDAFYVHLTRARRATAASFVKRTGKGIMRAYARSGILMALPPDANPLEVARDYYDTVNSNISLFLRDKPRQMRFRLENAQTDFPSFCSVIEADVNMPAALREFEIKHNASA